jgi:hypothetical protein
MPNGPAAWVGLDLGAKAGVHAMASACATGAEALALGLDIIRSGRADVVVAGGTESVIHPLPLAGFASMRAMSTRNDEPQKASRPWDKARDGFVLGEGAAILVLERAEHAAARGARVYARLAGAGLTSDGFDIVQPEPDGTGAARAGAAPRRAAGAAPAARPRRPAHPRGGPPGGGCGHPPRPGGGGGGRGGAGGGGAGAGRGGAPGGGPGGRGRGEKPVDHSGLGEQPAGAPRPHGACRDAGDPRRLPGARHRAAGRLRPLRDA